jgi:hypothetical protein
MRILDIVEVGSGSAIDFEMGQMASISGRGIYQGSSNGMEVEPERGTVR